MIRDLAHSRVRAALHQSRTALVTVAWLSALINVLLLGGPLYLMLVYDSVMPSGSMATLFGLLAMLVVIYAFQGLFDFYRSRILGDVAAALDERLAGEVHRLMSRLSLSGTRGEGDGLTPMRDLDAIRSFLAGPGPAALIDLPWLVFFLALLFLLHIWLGVTALVGALVLIGLTLLNDRYIREPTAHASRAQALRGRLALDSVRNAELVRALGMGEQMHQRWQRASADYNETQDRLSRAAGTLGGASRVFRLLLQSLVLTVGALLYLSGDASGGIVFAASVLAARALAPIDQAIGNWRAFIAARQGWDRLDGLFERLPEGEPLATVLPRPASELRVQSLAVAPPGSSAPVIDGLDFTLAAGDGLGVIGPSAAGKTTLARALTGVWPPAAGGVRLDGAELSQWPPDVLGRSLGYLPQQVELFEGTIAQNIARMDSSPRSDDVIAAARAAAAHDLVVGLDKGYETTVGPGGSKLSAGQRQRIGLARALYGDPFLVVLDEPNSNLDPEGEAALDRAVAVMRARGAIVVLIAHRPAALRQVNKVLILQNGRMTAFGERDDILKRLVVGSAATPLHPGRGRGPKAAEGGKR